MSSWSCNWFIITTEALALMKPLEAILWYGYWHQAECRVPSSNNFKIFTICFRHKSLMESTIEGVFEFVPSALQVNAKFANHGIPGVNANLLVLQVCLSYHPQRLKDSGGS